MPLLLQRLGVKPRGRRTPPPRTGGLGLAEGGQRK